ncbi:hypothetical protein LPB137_04945 [Poseidonibacter parvus]|uniref:DNA-binding protein n=1 Tax=Poseidonibacter parvus TaxID=1850254 RepID=A0A1P8KL09_9BACT|nr:hypothetical protein [Poseidonibacter parvus]APW65237.1 hypothetical protein LPB137_04945 [Poseidonibacter parvus]
MNDKDKIKFQVDLLFTKYGKLTLEPKEVSEVLGLTEKALENARNNGTGLPFTRLNGKQRSKPLYSIVTIAEQIINKQVKVLDI